MRVEGVRELRWNRDRGELEFYTEGGLEALPVSEARVILGPAVKRFRLRGEIRDKGIYGEWSVEFKGPVSCLLKEEEVVCE